MTDRREFLKRLAGGAAGVCFAPYLSAADPWPEMDRILKRIKPPVFPSRSFDITKYGAVGDNTFDCTEAIRKAIADCSSKGGGSVVVPKGEFLTGAVELKSRVNLHVSEGATLRFTHDTSKYPLRFGRWEGMELMNYSAMIYAFEQENIGISGKGTIDGNADKQHWWPWKGNAQGGYVSGPTQADDRARLYDMVARNVPVRDRVFGQGHYLRPQFIQPYRCKNLLVEGVRLLNSPMWQVTPCLCSNVTVRELYISSFGPNTDGCNPESCTDVVIKNCFFNTGDDCIAIKSGRNDDGRRLHTPSQNIVIQNCRMQDGHGGVTVGSEISGGVRNVFVENCNLNSPNLDSAIRIKNNALRGGLIENIYARNMTVGEIRLAALSVDFNYEEGANGPYKPICRNISIEKLKTQKTQYALYLRGFKDAPIENISLIDCDFAGVEKGNLVENVKDVNLRNVRINGKPMSEVA